METRTSQVAGNQEIFRRANERLRKAVEGVVSNSKPIPFVCECADEACMSVVDLSLAEYREIRAHPEQFAIVPGHPRIEGETIAATFDRYEVVSKPLGPG